MKAVALLLLALATGCATAPERLCDLERAGLSLLSSPPPDAEALLAGLRAESKVGLDERRFHWVWLESGAGELYLCTYRRSPVVTRSCGITVYRYAKTAEGHEGMTIGIAAC